jgi:hypothetical protein
VVTCASGLFRIRGVELEEGPITAILEAAATSVGVGMVLGGFVAGLVGVLLKLPRETLELGVLNAGYFMAALCLLVRAVDLATI